MSTTNTLPTSLVWLLAQCMVSLGTLHRHSFFFLFAQCVVLMSLGGPQKATLNSCTEHRTSSTQASTCTVHWQLLVQACLSWSAFVRCLVTCPLRLSSCVLQVDIFDTHTHTHTYIYIYGARGGAVGWGTALQAGRSRVRFPMVSLEFFIDIILSSRTMALGLTQPLTEMSTSNIYWE